MSEYELDLNIVREIDLEVDTTIYKGADGTTFYPTVSSAGIISWTNDGDKENPDPVNIKGPQGDQGPAGQDGTNGATFTPTVSTAGVISWSNDKGLPNPDSVNIKGPAGQNGQNGATFTPSVSTAGVISWTNDGGLPNPESVDIKGPAGQNGQGVPSGGTTGQVLKKTSATDYATAWADDVGGLTILSYGSSTWNDFLTAYNKNAIVYCRASSNADPSIGAQGRMAFMAYVNMSGSTPTSVEFQYYRSVTTHSDAQQGDQVFIYKLDNAGTWTVTTREAYTKIAAGTAMTSSYSSGTLTLSNDAAVPSGGTAGQVLTVNTSGGYGWETPSGGNGLPSGGSSGQFLKKNSGTDYDATWGTIYQVPTTGSMGQFLKKTGSGATNYGWSTIYTLPTGGSSGQFLKKTSGVDGACSWNSIHELPSGGTVGQVIKKKTAVDYDVEWGDMGGDILVVKFSYSGGTLISDTTFAAVRTAINAGKLVLGKLGTDRTYTVTYWGVSDITFQRALDTKTISAFEYIVFYENGTVTKSMDINCIRYSYSSVQYGFDYYFDDEDIAGWLKSVPFNASGIFPDILLVAYDENTKHCDICHAASINIVNKYYDVTEEDCDFLEMSFFCQSDTGADLSIKKIYMEHCLDYVYNAPYIEFGYTWQITATP